MRPLHIVYIASAARSGSTILDIVLGNHPRIESVGELKEFERLRWAQNDYCSCRSRAHDCPYWSPIHEQWTARLEESDLSSYTAQLGFFLRLKRWRRWASTAAAADSTFRRFQAQTLALYRTIQEVSGKDIIVDSSKGPGIAYFLSTLPEIKLSVVHLVRDGRAVAWSSMQAFKKDERAGVERDLHAKPAWKTALRWRVTNSLTEWAVKKGDAVRSIRLRYEDFTADPATELARVGTFLDEDFSSLVAKAAAGEEMEIGHKIGGSRIRMQGRIRLKAADDVWRRSMPAASRFQVRLVAGRQLAKYGYLAGGGA